MDALQIIRHCRTIYDPSNRATHIFEPRVNDMRDQFRMQYGLLRAAVNGTYHSGNTPNPGFAQFVYRRSVETIE